MKGDQKLIKVLNQLLADELTAINQYKVHSEMCDNWGYDKLHKAIEKRAIDEMKHAEKLIGRILFSPTHVYTNVGTYYVTLRVTDNDGASTTASTSVVILQSTTLGDSSEGVMLFNIEIPFSVLGIVVIACLIGVGAGFIIWLRRR